MKEELLELYRNNITGFEQVMRQFPHDDLAGPFLMSPNTTYPMQHTPLLVIGQETNGWTYYANDPDRQMKTYEEYEVGKQQASNVMWSTVRKIETVIGNEPCSCAWTNLNKFDLYGGRSHGKYEKAIATLDKLLPLEIEIVNPKMCLFFTGPHLDVRLSKTFSGLSFEPVAGWDKKQLCRLVHPQLPHMTFRSYHPRFLRLKSLEQAFVDFIAQANIYNVPVQLPSSAFQLIN